MYRINETSSCVEIIPEQEDCAVIFLHGLGSSGYDFLPWVRQFFPARSVYWLMPHAQPKSVAWLNNQVVPAWYNLYHTSPNSKEDLPGLALAAEFLNAEIEKIHERGIPYSKIFLMGFSQGAALALYTGLRFHTSLAGIAGFSGYMPSRNTLKINARQNVWLSHGDADEVLPIIFYNISLECMQKHADLHVIAEVFPNMAHEISTVCSKRFVTWFERRLVV